MVGLPCLASHRAKFHVGRMTWAVFTRIDLESCTWPVAIFTMDQRKEQRVCIKFCDNLGKSATETLKMIQLGFGDQSLSRTQVFQWHTQDQLHISWRQRTHRETHKLHEFKSSSVRTDVGPFATLLRRWKFVMGHANGSDGRIGHAPCRSQICAQDPDRWPEASSASSALNFVSSPPTMKLLV